MSEGKCSYRIAYEKQKKRAERAEAALEARDPTKSQIKRITAMADGRLAEAQSTIAELEAEVQRLRDAIKKAPHDSDCPKSQGQIAMLVGDMVFRSQCLCWKRTALGGDS